MGLVLGLCTLYYVWRPVFSGTTYSKAMVKDSMFTAAILGTLYWVTGLSGVLYPQAAFLDPSLVGTKYDAKILGLPGQSVVFSLHAVLSWVAYSLEASRLSKVKGE